MELKPNSSRALDGWLNSDAWYTNYTLDTNRFYQFIDAYQKEHGSQVDELVLAMEMRSRLLAKGQAPTPSLQKAIAGRVAFMLKVLEFLEVTGR